MNPYSGIALIVSIIVHGLLVAGFLATPSPATFSANQRKGVHLTQVSVRLQPVVPVITQPAIQSFAKRPEHAPKLAAATSAPIEQKAVQAASEIEQQAAPAPSAAIATAPAGSEFVSLFAPIISQPLGRGSWGNSKPSAPSIEPTQLQKQQAQLQLRSMLMDRLGNWVAWQTQQRTAVRCQMRLDLANQQARLSCTPAEKEAEVWSVLNGLLTAGPANDDGSVCLQIGTAQLSMTSCEGIP